MTRLMPGLLLAGLALVPAPLAAQDASFRTRLSIAGGLGAYEGAANQFGVGALARAAVSIESPSRPFSVRFEGSAHTFTTLAQQCLTIPGGGCGPQPAPSEVWALRVSAQWHVRGAPGGFYVGSGFGGYTRVGPSGQPALGYDLTLGMRRAGSGVFVEARYVRLANAPNSASIVPLTVGFLF